MITCDICPGEVEMIVKKKLSNHKLRHSSICRRRLFVCPVCDYEKVIYASGDADEKYIPEQGIIESRVLAKQESKNRE